MSSNEVVRLGISLIYDHLINELTKEKMEGRHRRPTRILCINCNIWINKMRRYRALELDTRVTTLLCGWVHPRIITEDDYVCEACKYLAIQRVGSSCDNHQAGASYKGHNHVCILCGTSILRRQSDKILRHDPSQLLQSMINILESRIAPRQITVSDRICHPCWLRTQREARRYGNFTDDTRTLTSSAGPAPEESQEDGQPGPNPSEPSPNLQADVQRILEQDMENYMEYKIMGSVKHIKMKLNTVPSRFCIRSEIKPRVSPGTSSRSTLTKARRLAKNSRLTEDCIESTASSYKSDEQILEIGKNRAVKATQVQILTTDKSIQVQLLSQESKLVQAKY